MPHSPTIAALTEGGVRDDVARQLAGVGTIEWFERADRLVERAAAGALDLAITALDDESGRSIAPTVVALAARTPSVPIVVYDRVNGATVRKLMAVLTTGLRIEAAVRPHEALEPVVRRVMSPFFRPGVAPVLLHHLVPRAPARLRVFMALAALTAASRRGVEEVARWSGVSARTIERRLRAAAWPAAHVVLQSCAGLDAVWLMSEYGWSARRVQRVREFPHESSITRLLARYCGVRPATLREDGGFGAALAHVTGVLTPRHPAA